MVMMSLLTNLGPFENNEGAIEYWLERDCPATPVNITTCRLFLSLFAHLSLDSDTELVWLIRIRSTLEPVGHV